MTNTTNRNSKQGKQASGKQAPLMWRENGQSEVTVAWSQIDAELLQETIASVTSAGAAIILGVTSDGGAYSVTILSDDSKMREYPHGKMACEDLLRSVKEWFQN